MTLLNLARHSLWIKTCGLNALCLASLSAYALANGYWLLSVFIDASASVSDKKTEFPRKTHSVPRKLLMTSKGKSDRPRILGINGNIFGTDSQVLPVR